MRWQNEHPFGYNRHFSQIEPFEKPWFVVMKALRWNLKPPNVGWSFIIQTRW